MTTSPVEAPEIGGYSLSGPATESRGKAPSVPLSGCPPLYRADSRETPDRTKTSWLEDKIITSRRAARLRPCPRCGDDTLVGPDHDTVAYVARVDTHPVTRLEEAAAVLAGRGSWDLVRGDLWRRGHEHLVSPKHEHPIHLEHICTKETLF